MAGMIKDLFRHIFDSFEAVWLNILKLKKRDSEFFEETEAYEVVKPKESNNYRQQASSSPMESFEQTDTPLPDVPRLTLQTKS